MCVKTNMSHALTKKPEILYGYGCIFPHGASGGSRETLSVAGSITVLWATYSPLPIPRMGTAWLCRPTKTPSLICQIPACAPSLQESKRDGPGNGDGVNREASFWASAFLQLQLTSGVTKLPWTAGEIQYNHISDSHSWIQTTFQAKMMGWERGTLKPEVLIHGPVKISQLFSESVKKCLRYHNWYWGVQATQLSPRQKICRVKTQL